MLFLTTVCALLHLHTSSSFVSFVFLQIMVCPQGKDLDPLTLGPGQITSLLRIPCCLMKVMVASVLHVTVVKTFLKLEK